MRSRIRSFLLLLLLGTILIEALALFQVPLCRAMHRAYPQVGLDEDGWALYWDVNSEVGPDGEMRRVRVLDDSRNAPEVLDLGSTEALARLRFESPGLWPVPNLELDRPRFLRELRAVEDRFVPYSPLEMVAKSALNAVERRRRGLPDQVWLESGERKKPPIEWNVEENRLVCRETASARIVASFGPDGYVRGENADEGRCFGRISAGPIRMTTGASTPADWGPLFLFDREARVIYVITIAKEEGSLPSDSVDPATVAVETRPLHPFQASEVEIATWPCASFADRHVLVFLEDGSVIADFEMEPNERGPWVSGAMVIRSEGHPGRFVMGSQHGRPSNGTVAMQTALDPQPFDGERRRLRLLRPGHPEIVRDAVLTPTRAGEVFLANLTASLALLRPPPLNVASSLSPLPKGQHWWWRDPWLAAGSYPGWLVASLAIAAFCAWRARRAARERCATTAAVRFWTAAVFLLGPLGLLWMRLVLPRVPVESVGGAQRAVNLDASPSSSAPWPDPEPLGIEVIS